MQFRPKVAAIAAALAAAVLASTAAGSASAATMRFSGGAAPTPPTDLPSFLRNVYCERLPAGAAARDKACRAVIDWMVRNSGRPTSAWSAPPIIN